MRAPDEWHLLLRTEKAFLVLEQNILAGKIHDYRQIHPEAFAWHGWDQLPAVRLFPLVRPFLSSKSLARTVGPGYGRLLDGVDHARSNPQRTGNTCHCW
jgi:hypothetical protein